MSKRIAAVAMSGRIGESFDAIVTGVTPHGTFVRVVQPHVEGLLAQGQQGADVGDKLRVKLVRTDVERGFIPARVGRGGVAGFFKGGGWLPVGAGGGGGGGGGLETFGEGE